MGNWFEVDKAGLAALTARRDKTFLLAELLSNAWDAPGVTRVDVSCEPIPARPEARITVTDDSPEGFTDLSHAFTLFAESAKRADPEVRGRFNLGEKLSLAMASSASITTTTGRVSFDENGRHRSTRQRTTAGSVVTLVVPMTRQQLDQARQAVQSFIVPVPTFVDGTPIPDRSPLARFQVRLPTEIRGEDGNMRRTERLAQVVVYAPPEGLQGRIYELGVPICLTGDTFDVDIRQKVPMSLERESVTDAYLRRVRAAVLANCATLLDEAATQASWVSSALEAEDLPAEAVTEVIRKRYGDRVVSYDPSDPEANSRAAAAGFHVVHGGSFSAQAWASIRNAAAIRPAGQVTPTPKPWAENGTPIAPLEQSPSMRRYTLWCKRLALLLIGEEIEVEYYRQFNNASTRAAYGNNRLQFAYNKLGGRFFEGPIGEPQLELLIHELAHHYASNHLSEEYYRALTRLGARLALAVGSNASLLEIPSE